MFIGSSKSCLKYPQYYQGNVPFETVYQSQRAHSETAKSRSIQYQENYLKYLTDLEHRPTLHGILTVRCLLDAHQNFLRKYGFTDPYWIQKKVVELLIVDVFELFVIMIMSFYPLPANDDICRTVTRNLAC